MSNEEEILVSESFDSDWIEELKMCHRVNIKYAMHLSFKYIFINEYSRYLLIINITLLINLLLK